MKSIYNFLQYFENILYVFIIFSIFSLTALGITSLNPLPSSGSVAGISTTDSLEFKSIYSNPNHISSYSSNKNKFSVSITPKALPSEGLLQPLVEIENKEQIPKEVKIKTNIKGNVLSNMNLYLSSENEILLLYSKDIHNKNTFVIPENTTRKYYLNIENSKKINFPFNIEIEFSY